MGAHSHHHAASSARTRALATHLRATIAPFTAREPKTTTAEVDAALASLRSSKKYEDRNAMAIVVLVIAAFIAAGIGAGYGRAIPAGDALWMLLLLTVAAMGIVFALLFVGRSR